MATYGAALKVRASLLIISFRVWSPSWSPTRTKVLFVYLLRTLFLLCSLKPPNERHDGHPLPHKALVCSPACRRTERFIHLSSTVTSLRTSRDSINTRCVIPPNPLQPLSFKDRITRTPPHTEETGSHVHVGIRGRA